MTGLGALIRRNCKLFFKDKGMFFTSLITPVILLVLYATFLAKVYRDSFAAAMPAGFAVDAALIDGTVGGQLVSSLLAVCCVTVAFCSNLLMVQDKVSGAIRDLTVSPLRHSTLALSYYIASALSTLLISLTALGISFLYLWRMGWYMSLSDVLAMLLDVVLLTLFGVALSSCVNFPLKTNGQASAVGTIVSAGYGFICGAYMPISQFAAGIRNFVTFVPGTYGTVLFRRFFMGGAIEEMAKYAPAEAISALQDAFDYNIYFFDHLVPAPVCFAILGITVLVLAVVFAVVVHCMHKVGKTKRKGNS